MSHKIEGRTVCKGEYVVPDENAIPCCLFCKWSKPKLGPQVPAWLNEEPRIECESHNFVVWEPRLHFCSHVTNTAGEIHSVVERERIVGDQMYVWIEIQYRVLASPDLRRTHYELVPIAPLARFAALTITEKRARYERLHHEKWIALKQQHSEEVEEEGMYQKTKHFHDRKRLKD